MEQELHMLWDWMEGTIESFLSPSRHGFDDRRCFRPAVDVYETAEEVVVILEIAGVERRAFEVQLSGNVLEVSGQRRIPAPAGAERCHQMEIDCGPFLRRIHLPIPIAQEGLRAVYQGGFLRVTIRKASAGSTTRIPIQSE